MSDTTDTAAAEEAAMEALLGRSAEEGGGPGADAPAEPSVESKKTEGAADRSPARQPASNGNVVLKDPDLQRDMEDALRSASLLPDEIVSRFKKADKRLAQGRDDAIALKASQLASSLTGLGPDGEEDEDADRPPFPPTPGRGDDGADDGEPKILDADSEKSKRLDAEADAKEEKQKRKEAEAELEEARKGKIRKGLGKARRIGKNVKEAKEPS